MPSQKELVKKKFKETRQQWQGSKHAAWRTFFSKLFDRHNPAISLKNNNPT